LREIHPKNKKVTNTSSINRQPLKALGRGKGVKRNRISRAGKTKKEGTSGGDRSQRVLKKKKKGRISGGGGGGKEQTKIPKKKRGTDNKRQRKWKWGDPCCGGDQLFARNRAEHRAWTQKETPAQKKKSKSTNSNL